MDMHEKLREKLKKEEKMSIAIGVIFSAIFVVLIALVIMEKIIDVENGDTETAYWLDFGTICMIICLIVVFTKYILFVCLDLKDSNNNYENIKIVVIQVKTNMSLLYGTWSCEVLAENVGTGEQFSFKGSGDLKEGNTYLALKAKHSKLLVYEPAEDK